MQEAQEMPSKINSKTLIPRHVIKVLKDKKMNLESSREKGLDMYKVSSIKLTLDLSEETLEA